MQFYIAAFSIALALLVPAAPEAAIRGTSWQADWIFLEGMYEVKVTRADLAGRPVDNSVTYELCLNEMDLVLHDFRLKEDCMLHRVKSNGDTIKWEMSCKFAGSVTTVKGRAEYGPIEFTGWEEIAPYRAAPLYRNLFKGRRLGNCRPPVHIRDYDNE